MKKNSLFILLAVLLFVVGCGSSGSEYDQYGETGDSGKDDDTADSASDNDSVDTADEPSDADTDVQPDDDGETVDEDSPSEQDFWSTCEGVIVCTKNCAENDSNCIGSCYGKATDDEQDYYRGWIGCFNENCAEDKTAECSAENCAEWDELCHVAAAFEYKVYAPAPYGNAEFAGDFSLILGNTYPTSENQITFKSFVSGQISSMTLAPGGTIISFVRMVDDARDGKVVEVYQVPYNVETSTPKNPVVILKIKVNSATEGNHTVGVADDSDSRLLVVDVDSKYDISCYHAFGIGSFKISKAVIEIGSTGVLNFSNGQAELFSPYNIPELGGDARETLGVKACSVIQ